MKTSRQVTPRGCRAVNGIAIAGTLWLLGHGMGALAQDDNAQAPEPQPVAVEAPVVPLEPAPAEEVALAPAEAEDREVVVVVAADDPAAETASSVIADDKISVILDDVPLSDVVRLFTRISGANIVAATTNLKGSVTANLTDVAWRPAFESILERQNLMLIEKPPASNIYVIEPRPAGAPDPLVAETIRLSHAKVADVTKVVEQLLGKDGSVVPFPSGNTIVVHASAVKIAEVKRIVESIDFPRLQVCIEAKFVELTDSASKKLGIDWAMLDELEITGGFNAGYQYNSADTRTIKNTGADTTERYYDENGREVQVGSSGNIVRDVTNPDTGVVSPTAEPVPTRSVVSSFEPSSLNVRDVAKTFGATLSASELSVVLSMMKKEDGVKVVSNPKVLVANEEKALIDMTTKEPYVVVSRQKGTEDSPGDTITTTLATIPGKSDPFVGEAFFSYGITLAVTPRVNTSSNITVTIVPTISDSPSYFSVGGDTKYPIITMKRIETVFSLGDGRTAAIGGLSRTIESDRLRKVPFLGDIPVLGKYLFSHKGRSRDQVETIIFVTIKIVSPEAPDVPAGLPESARLIQKHVDTEGRLIKNTSPENDLDGEL